MLPSKLLRRRADFVKIIFFVMMLAIVLICSFSSRFLHVVECESVFKPEIAMPNVLSGLVGMAVTLLLGFLLTKCLDERKTVRTKIVFFTVSALFCGLQMLFAWNYYFETNWDVDHLITAARDIVAGNDTAAHEPYFSENPNNMLLLRVFAWIVAVAHWLGMGQNDVFLLIVFQCLVVWLSGAMLFQILCKLYGRAMAWTGYFAYFSLVVLSPWVSIPYSDTVALFFPLAIVWLVFTSAVKRPCLKVAFVCFLAMVGYRIKPQTLLVFLSLIAVYGCRLWHVRKRFFAKVYRNNIINSSIAVCAGLLVGVLVCSLGIKSLDINTRANSAFGMPHYLMMGMNTKTLGSYDGDDVAFSRSFESKSQRSKANFSEAGKRIGRMGPTGFMRHIGEKTLINYFDGTFGWGWEGNFYKNILPRKNATLSPFARDVYYTTWPRGKNYHYWSNYAQIFWMGVLMLSLLACFGKSKRGLQVVMLSLVLVTLFEALFEARARYMFCFSPLFVITAVQGIQFLCKLCFNKRISKKC